MRKRLVIFVDKGIHRTLTQRTMSLYLFSTAVKF